MTIGGKVIIIASSPRHPVEDNSFRVVDDFSQERTGSNNGALRRFPCAHNQTDRLYFLGEQLSVAHRVDWRAIYYNSIKVQQSFLEQVGKAIRSEQFRRPRYSPAGAKHE